jgi:hypothetical protein
MARRRMRTRVELVELFPISSKRRTEVLSDATNQGIEVIDQLKIEIMFSDGNGADFILELLQELGRMRLDRINPRKE